MVLGPAPSCLPFNGNVTHPLYTHAFLCGVGRLEVFDPVWLRIAEKMRRAVFLLKSCWRSLDLIGKKDNVGASLWLIFVFGIGGNSGPMELRNSGRSAPEGPVGDCDVINSVWLLSCVLL